jgi:hypothetical protein
MKCDRTKPQTEWTRLGKRAAAAGYSVEWAVQPIAPHFTKVREWIAAGHAEQTARIARAKRTKLEPLERNPWLKTN